MPAVGRRLIFDGGGYRKGSASGNPTVAVSNQMQAMGWQVEYITDNASSNPIYWNYYYIKVSVIVPQDANINDARSGIIYHLEKYYSDVTLNLQFDSSGSPILQQQQEEKDQQLFDWNKYILTGTAPIIIIGIVATILVVKVLD